MCWRTFEDEQPSKVIKTMHYVLVKYGDDWRVTTQSQIVTSKSVDICSSHETRTNSIRLAAMLSTAFNQGCWSFNFCLWCGLRLGWNINLIMQLPTIPWIWRGHKNSPLNWTAKLEKVTSQPSSKRCIKEIRRLKVNKRWRGIGRLLDGNLISQWLLND